VTATVAVGFASSPVFAQAGNAKGNDPVLRAFQAAANNGNQGNNCNARNNGNSNSNSDNSNNNGNHGDNGNNGNNGKNCVSPN
jgi:hypothetical protein